ncbi:hypothetical protein AKJ16_DCAP20102 [Drosera capensis]
MISAGQALCASSSFIAPEQLPETETRILKFGELQVAVTPANATVGATIAVLFGTLSWIISQGIQSVPESSLQYANDNALQLAKRSAPGDVLCLDGLVCPFLSRARLTCAEPQVEGKVSLSAIHSRFCFYMLLAVSCHL